MGGVARVPSVVTETGKGLLDALSLPRRGRIQAITEDVLATPGLLQVHRYANEN